jgi:hypothetical protein
MSLEWFATLFDASLLELKAAVFRGFFSGPDLAPPQSISTDEEFLTFARTSI